MTRSAPVRRSPESALRSPAGIADGWATRAFTPGANLAISAAQLARSEAGAIKRLGLQAACHPSLPSPLLRLLLEHQQQRQDLDRLAQSHVVGEAGAKPQSRQQIKPLHARALIWAQRSAQRFAGIGAGPARPAGASL